MRLRYYMILAANQEDSYEANQLQDGIYQITL